MSPLFLHLFVNKNYSLYFFSLKFFQLLTEIAKNATYLLKIGTFENYLDTLEAHSRFATALLKSLLSKQLYLISAVASENSFLIGAGVVQK